MIQEYPEAFEETTLAILHNAFLKASSIMAEIGFRGNGIGRYWEIKHAAQNILEAMDKIEDACFEWRSYHGRNDSEAEEEKTPLDEIPVSEVAAMFGKTEEQFVQELEEAHAAIERGEGIDVTAEVLETENRVMREILEKLFVIREIADMRKCRECGVAVLHMDHLRVGEAIAIEKRVRLLLGQKWEESIPD
jgi:hypothetical protein